MSKKHILLVMQRRMLADSLIAQVGDCEHLALLAEPDYASAGLTAEAYQPAVVVVEVPEAGAWRSAEKCLEVADSVRGRVATCRVVLLCPESDAESCRQIVAAKRANRIDDFLFYEASVHYLFSKLESLLRIE